MLGLYLLLLAVLIVRVRPTGTAPAAIRPGPDEPLWLTRVHHALFFGLLAGPPLERLLLGGATAGRAAGVCLFAAGVALYRLAGRDLGVALSPFTQPRGGAPLVTSGLYRHLRHPMYLGEALIALGAPLALGSRWVIVLAGPALLVLVARIVREETALFRAFPEYPLYAAKTKRIVPCLY